MIARCLGVLALSGILMAQEKPDDEVKLVFNYRDTRVEDVLEYVSKATGWKFVYDKTKLPEKATITAISDGPVSGDQALVILDTALRQHGLATLNPYAPRLPRKGEAIKIVKAEDAASMTMEIHYGSDPEKIAPTDKMITQIVGLKGANVVDIQKELKDVIEKALGSDGKWSISTYSNALILMGRSENIRRVVMILQVIDVKAAEELKTHVFPLKNADATETTKILSEVFKKETQAASKDANPFGRMFEMFGGRGRQPDQGPTPKAVAGEIVRIVADTRTNSVVCVATEQNMKTISDLVEKLDAKSAEIIKLKHYPLQYADATEVAKVITDIFSEQGTSSSQQTRRQQGNPFRPMFMGPQQPAAEEAGAASREVRAVADTRTNSVIVAASEKNFAIIDDMVRSMDRQVSDMLLVKIYELKNGDAKEMATVLRELFRPQVNATQQSGRTTGSQQQQGRGGFMQMFGGGGQTGSGSLPPNQEVEITSDTRTNAVIVKASPEYMKIMDTVVDQLDRNPTESVSTYTIPLRNADAATVAKVLQDLLRGGSSSSSQRQGTGLPGIGGTTGTQQSTSTRSGSNSSTRSGNSGSSTRRGGNLGPLQDPQPQDETPFFQDEEDRQRGIQGQVDVQSDPTTNTLVIRTSPRNYKAIEGIVKDLDKLRPQVMIKVLIADVTLTDNMQFGVEGYFQDKFSYGNHNNSHKFGTDFNLASQGYTYSLTGDDIGATLNAMATDGILKILATPRILVLDNQTANINVGKEVPVITNTQVNQLGNTVNTVRYENVGILLQVTPHINPDGLVTMIVHPEVSDIASQAESVKITEGASSPTFIVNSADTTVAIRNGQTVVIGGLIREVVDESKDGIPILKDIPLLGLLFSSTTKKKSKRELMIFLTPYVAYTTTELEELTELEKSKLKLIDQKDIEAESDKWLERVRH